MGGTVKRGIADYSNFTLGARAAVGALIVIIWRDAMNYESKVEQDRRVLREMNSQYTRSLEIRADAIAMADLILSGDCEHVTMWTDAMGRARHSNTLVRS
jgi:hypothetical protein